MGLSDLPFEAPYSLDNRHKHIPEMMMYSGINVEPQFVPPSDHSDAVCACRCRCTPLC